MEQVTYNDYNIINEVLNFTAIILFSYNFFTPHTICRTYAQTHTHTHTHIYTAFAKKKTRLWSDQH